MLFPHSTSVGQGTALSLQVAGPLMNLANPKLAQPPPQPPPQPHPTLSTPPHSTPHNATAHIWPVSGMPVLFQFQITMFMTVMQAQEQAQAEMAAALEAEEMQVQEQEWNMAELERIQEQQVLCPSLLVLLRAVEC